MVIQGPTGLLEMKVINAGLQVLHGCQDVLCTQLQSKRWNHLDVCARVAEGPAARCLTTQVWTTRTEECVSLTAWRCNHRRMEPKAGLWAVETGTVRLCVSWGKFGVCLKWGAHIKIIAIILPQFLPSQPRTANV